MRGEGQRDNVEIVVKGQDNRISRIGLLIKYMI
jgi:hypothetical protein